MTGRPDYLEIVGNLFECLDEDALSNCKRCIEKILEVPETNDHKVTEQPNLFATVNLSSKLSSLKILLQFYKSAYSNSSIDKPILSLKSLFEMINNNFCNNENNFNFSSLLEQELYEIISSSFSIGFLQSSESNFIEMVEFHSYYLKFIKEHCKGREGYKKKIAFSLKVLSNIYSLLSNFPYNDLKVIYFSKFSTPINKGNEVDEYQLFTYLIIYGEDDIFLSTLLLIFPKFIKIQNNFEILNHVWKEISDLSIKQSTFEKNSRFLLIMCYVLCVFEGKEVYKNYIIKSIFRDSLFWKLIKFGLTKRNSLLKKQALYLFKKSVDWLINCDENISCYEHHFNYSKNLSFKDFWWDTNFKLEFSNIYEKLIVILEYFDEQQVHILKPIFGMMEEIIHKILSNLDKEKRIHFSWIVLIYEQALTHESFEVVKRGLYGLMDLPYYFYSNSNLIKDISSLLVLTLNNTKLYYNNGLEISQKLSEFLKNLSKLETSQVFFCQFILELCNLTWSPEALFFVIHALAQVQKNPFWQNKEISEIKAFVLRAFNTHNKIIRIGIQSQFLKSILALTDHKTVSFDNFLLLIASFFHLECLQRKSIMWNEIIIWIRNSFSLETAINYFSENFSNDDQIKNNEKHFAFISILFHDAYVAESNSVDSKETGSLLKLISLKFKNLENRACFSNMNNYLSVFCHILEENFNFKNDEDSDLLKCINPSFSLLVSHSIFRGIKEISLNPDYYIISLYVETFENILRSQVISSSELNSIIKDVCTYADEYVRMQEQRLNISHLGLMIYGYMRLLKTSLVQNTKAVAEQLLNKHHLTWYIFTRVNEPLEEKTSSTQTLKGKMNSEFLESKWHVFEFLARNEKFRAQHNNKEIELSVEYFFVSCNEALMVGNYEILFPVMTLLRYILPECEEDKGKLIIDVLWKLIMERRKTEVIKTLIEKFVDMLFQQELMTRDSFSDVFMKYSNLILADSSLAIVNILVKQLQRLDFENNLHPLLCYLLTKILIYGPVQRKDERLTVQVCYHIDSFGLYKVRELNTSNEIRGRAVEMVLRLNKNITKHQKFAWELVKQLIETERDANKNKTRYFGDSHIHRVKHRLMQALLILEPLISFDKEKFDYLYELLINSLKTENSQPSIKYQQEWLLVRLILKNHFLNFLAIENFWNNFKDHGSLKTKGICSLIGVLYHLFKLLPREYASEWINRAIPTLLSFCMDQHFEVRLYATVVIEKLYKLAEKRGLDDIVRNNEIIYNCVRQSILRGCKGNAAKNYQKLQADFYFNTFNPVEHYSLKTIYFDLPRLANVGPDEWICPRVFGYCGIKHENSNILMESNSSLENVQSAKWVVNRSDFIESTEANKNLSEEFNFINNYQKKMIPLKAIIPSINETLEVSDNSKNSGGLIVVASLIDRIPNLGGLARTCEIFGASEYIVGSLKYVEDKQFISISVTAEKWITITEVKPENLLNYLIEMKEKGYKIIGAEQALYSQTLNKVEFPKKSLLLLGNEKEGIPPNLLPLLDVCVEIPQVGIIRSLNVHVTGALFIWEYAKQNYFSSSN